MADIFINGLKNGNTVVDRVKELSNRLNFYDFKDLTQSKSLDDLMDDVKDFIYIHEFDEIFYRLNRKKHEFISLMYVISESELSDNDLGIEDVYDAIEIVLNEMYSEYMDFRTIYLIGQDIQTKDWVVCAFVLNANKTGKAFSSGFRHLFRTLYDESKDVLDSEFGLSVLNKTEFGDIEREKYNVHRVIILDALKKARNVSIFKNDDDLLEFLFRQGVPSIIDGDVLICTAKDYYGEYQKIPSQKIHGVYSLNNLRTNYVV